MADLASALAGRGLPTVVMNRRGYGGIDLGSGDVKFAFYGFDEDLDEVFLAVGRRHPGRPVALIGFSAGSGFAGRYSGSRSHLSAWKGSVGATQQGPQLLCSVACDPGYDVSPDGAIARIRWPYSWGVNLGIKYCYAFRHRERLRQRSESTSQLVGHMLRPSKGLQETYRAARKLAGAGGSSAWLELQQPCIDQITVPCLMVNSRDDPICVWENVEQFAADIAANPNLAFAELWRGAHGCKFGFWGCGSVMNTMIGEFVTASWQEWSSANGSSGF